MLRQKCGTHTTIAAILREPRMRLTMAASCESMTWLIAPGKLPIWSRRVSHNIEGSRRHKSSTKCLAYHVEMSDRLWSLWGGLHPRATLFAAQARGQQALACCVVACCVASVFKNLAIWTAKLLDATVVDGDKYYRESRMQSHNNNKQQLGPDDLCLECAFQDMRFMAQVQLVCFGELYNTPACNNMGLFEALNYFFTRYQWGILECQQKYLSFGYSNKRDAGYFIYDCNAWEMPIFPDNMGASYLLRTKELFLLLYCLVVTLNVRQRNVGFRLYVVDMSRIINYSGNVEN